jgi:hypothetical protein
MNYEKDENFIIDCIIYWFLDGEFGRLCSIILVVGSDNGFKFVFLLYSNAGRTTRAGLN